MPNCDSFYVWEATRFVVTAVLGIAIIGCAFGAGYMYHHAAPCHCAAAAATTGCPPVPRPIVGQPPSMAPAAAPAPTPFPARPRRLGAAAMVLLPPPPPPPAPKTKAS
ncbi:hypothetical protein BRADI_1g59502v3 [Brachypodium distachyon]|uniref:Uncharacterized protein n=1 Tax=Brachypodium distachyon TaxID=15368 RepID=A0A0Q3JUM2_BRADI|nr:hypothetical protein BRADI_1g59502v3 [Brachypodium distachyon]